MTREPTFTCDDVPALRHVRDDDLRTAVVELFDRARAMAESGDVDLIVLTARRLACTYLVCRRAGMPMLGDAQVVSDRWLEGQPVTALRGRSVLVLDDTVIAGTTLDRLHERLTEAVGPDGAVRLLAMCEASDQRLHYLLDAAALEVLVQCQGDRAREFGADLVRAFFDAQIPFVSDFPVSRPLDLSTSDLLGVLEADGWSPADVSHPLTSGDEQDGSAFSLIPTTSWLDAFRASLPATVRSLVDACKIRLFVRHPADTDDCTVVVVPIALLGPARPRTLQRAIDQITGSLGMDGPDDLASRVPEAAHRMVQIYVACRAMARFWPALERAGLSPLDHTVLDREHVRLYFGEPATSALLAAFDKLAVGSAAPERDTNLPEAEPDALAPRPTPSALLEHTQIRELLLQHRLLIEEDGVSDEPTPGKLTKIGLLFTYAIVEVFGFIDERLEQPQRAELRKLPDRQAYDAWCTQHTRLIDLGLSLAELRRELMPGCPLSDVWCRTLITLGIDTGNDLGVIVPVTHHDQERDVIQRVYRLGETASLASAAAGTGHDPLIVRGLGRRPIRSTNVAIRDALDPIDSNAIEDALDFEQSRGPRGRIVHLYDGEVVRIHDDEFSAELEAPDGSVRLGHFPRELVESQRDRLKVGAPLVWRVLDGDGSTGRSSVVRLFPMARIDGGGLLADARAAGLLPE